MSTAKGFLKRVLEEKKREVERRRRLGLFFRPFWERTPLNLLEQLRNRPFSVIAEVKRASPSKGLLREEFDPVEIARSYERAGAGAISVITDETFFMGSLEYLAAVRASTGLPVLRKDFIVDPVQIEEARAFGADAVLLIATLLSQRELELLAEKAEELGLSVLVEVHDEDDLKKALDLDTALIGINNRNLRDLTVDVKRAFALFEKIPKDRVVIAESGISEPEVLLELKRKGFKGALIGEHLVRSSNPEETLRRWNEVLGLY